MTDFYVLIIFLLAILNFISLLFSCLIIEFYISKIRELKELNQNLKIDVAHLQEKNKEYRFKLKNYNQRGLKDYE